MKPTVEHGFIITKPDGRPWDEYLYPTRETAERLAKLNSSLRMFPARRIHSLRRVNETTAKGWTDLVIDRDDA